MTEWFVWVCELPWPPSMNTYWRNVKGTVLTSRKGRAYRKTVNMLSLIHRFPSFGTARVKVSIEAFPPDRRKRDLDNLLKPLMDCLEACSVFNNDEQVDQLSIKRCEVVKDGLVKVYIEVIDE